MAAIEVITSQETEVTLKKPNGEPYTILVRIWNETVSNLTLMALGSSAPEILLSVIEIFGNNFEAGELGPGTIVGSAAYNLFIIIAICILVIPDGEVRRIARNDVFWVTVIWSTFAYIWLYLILGVISPNVVEAWEGILTFAFFFLTVINAYIANRYFPSLGTRYLKGKAITSFTSRTATYSNKGGEVRLENGNGTAAEQTDSLINTIQDPDVLAFEEHKQLFWDTFTQIRAKHPDLDIKEVGKLTAWQALAKMPKSRAVRRVQAIRKLTAGVPLFREFDIIEPLVPGMETKITVSFSPSQYICMENIGKVLIQVEVDRGSIQEPTIVTVHYKTIEDSAKAGDDYEPIQGIITFLPHEIK
uniref:Sodium/calcium exchanger 1 n=1 Tax=Panagrolaimus davidi TaxID=227884 RepID=A0A914PYD3_9BILA